MYFRRLLFASYTIWLCATFAGAQAPADWQRVDALRAGTSIIIETRNGAIARGKFAASTTDTITIRSDDRSTSIVKSDIDSVYRAKKGSRLKRILVGAAAGAGIGTGIGILIATTTKEPLAAAGGLLYGVPAGAIIGGLTGRKDKKGEILYRAR